MSPIRGFYGSQLKNPTTPPTISINPVDYYSMVRTGGYIDIDVTANGSWTSSIVEGGTGVSYTPQSGNAGTTSVRITWDSNGSKFCRYVQIKFVNSTANCYFDGAQSGILETECPRT